MGHDVEHVRADEVELLDHDETVAQGKWLNFDEMTTEQRAEMSRRGNAARARKRELRKLAQLEVYTQAHRELASQILGTKMFLLDGLVSEMTDESGSLDTRRLDKDRMKLLMQLLEQLQKTAFPPTTKVEHSGGVDVRHEIAQLSRRLSKPDPDA